jgi:DMSO reductase family type II enzyme chaperone
MAVYRFLAEALGKPTPRRHCWLVGPDYRRGLETLCASFGLPAPAGELIPEAYADAESRYIACFEVGMPAPPVALLCSHYNRREPAPRIIYEHVLFYQRFGARLAAGNLEPADHLLNELAFLIWLDELLLAGQAELASILRARLDFLQRHAAAWPGRAARDAEENLLPPVYVTLLHLLAAAVAQDLELSRAAAEPLAEAKS